MSSKAVIWWIVGVAIVLRVVVGLVHPFEFPDSKDYDGLARAIVEGREYEVGGLYATRMPGYPVFVAGVYWVFGYSLRAVLVVQAILSGGVVWLTYLLARRVSGMQAPPCRLNVALVAAGLVAVDPLSIAFSASLLTETVFTLVLVGGVYVCVRLVERPGTWGWVWLAVVWVVAVYLRASAFWCIVPLWIVLIFAAYSRRGKLISAQRLAVVMATLFISLLPWQLRNYAIFSPDRVDFTTLEGISLYEAVYPEATGGPRQDLIELPVEMKSLNEAQRNAEWSRRAWQFIRDDPGRIAGLAVRKVARMWSPVLNAAEFRNVWVQIALAVWYVPMFLMALVGIWPMSSRKALLLVPIFYFTGIHAIFLGSVRYRVPLMPLLSVFAAIGIVWLVQCVRKPNRE